MNDIRLRVLAAAFLFGTAAAAQAADQTVLASVGERTITSEDLRAFEPLAEKALSPELKAAKRDSALLRILIHKTVLLAEARRRGIGEEGWFGRQLQARVDAQVVDRYTTALINEEVSVSQEEMEEHFAATHRDRALRYAGILVETEEEAKEILELVRDGADFAELARERSLFEKTREQGGDTGIFLLRDETDPPIRPIFQLEPGALSEPVSAPFRGRRHFAVFKILDALPVGLETASDEVEQEIFGRKRAERERVVLDSLRDRYAPRIIEENVTSAAAKFAAGGLDEKLRKLPLCAYDGGEITVEEYLTAVGRMEGGFTSLADPSRVAKMLKGGIIPSVLFLEGAKTLGLHEDQRTLQWREREKEDMLVSTLKKREVNDRVPETTFLEAEKFYKENPEKFMTWETVGITEIMVGDRGRAEELRRDLEAGADAGELARNHTIREGLDHHDGLLTLNKGTQFRYGPPLFEAARKLAPGDIGGPVELEEGYSVFKMVSRVPSQVKPFNETSQKRARAYVRIDRYRRTFIELVGILWEQHKVKVFVDYL